MSLEIMLERIALALEKIAAGEMCPARKSSGCCPPGGQPVRVIAPTEITQGPTNVEEQAAEDADVLKRDMLKKALREKGIKFKDAARTETLQKLLDAANAAGIPKVEPEALATGMAAATEVPVKTKEEARDALVALSASKGKVPALTVLKTVGKAEKLSDVEPRYYGAIVVECKKLEAANG